MFSLTCPSIQSSDCCRLRDFTTLLFVSLMISYVLEHGRVGYVSGTKNTTFH